MRACASDTMTAFFLAQEEISAAQEVAAQLRAELEEVNRPAAPWDHMTRL